MNIIEENKIVRGIPIILCKRGDDSKKPLVIMSHGFTGSKKDIKRKGWLRELAESGYYAVAIDNRLHGDRPGPDFTVSVIKSLGKIDLFVLRKAIKETSDDVKLLIDELSLLADVDRDKIAMIGISMGGFITYRSIVIDDRIKVGIPIISSPFWDDIPGDVLFQYDEKSKIELKALAEEYQPAGHMDRYYPTSLLMQVGDADKHYNLYKVKKFYNELKEYYSDCPEKIKLIIYPDTKHEFKQEMWEEALQWLKEKL
jgi:dienelactone hydrolase